MTIAHLPLARDVPAITAAGMARVDRVAIDELGIPVEALMESAARGVARVAREMLGGSVAGRRIVALAGRGNNGGDALAAARILYGWGADARAVVVPPLERLRDVPRAQYDALERVGVRAVAFDPDGPDELERADLVVDGLLGYSAKGAPRDETAELIRRANRCGAPILAVDLPSGLDPDTGSPLGVAIRAAVTATLALPKSGLPAAHARALVGELVLVDIGIPAAAYERRDVDPARIFADGDVVRI